MTWTKVKVAAAAALSLCVAFGYATGGGDEPPKAAPGVGSPARRPANLRAAAMPDYVVEPPDILLVEVADALPGRPIGGEHLVRPDGTITLGFYGDIYVANLTIRETKEKVAIHLRKYLDDKSLGLVKKNRETGKVEAVAPALSDRISVALASCNSKWFNISGEVGTPGRFPCTGNESVLDAINLAGGLTERGEKVVIRLLRPAPTKADAPQVLPVQLSAIMNRGDTATNYRLMAGDRLVVYPDAKTDPAAMTDLEGRLQVVERKLDEVLKALERLPKP